MHITCFRVNRARKSRVYLAWRYEIHAIIVSLGTVRAQPRFRSHVKSMGDFRLLQITVIFFHYWNMKERVFLSNNQDGIIENYWMMHFLNVTDVLTNRVNCSGSTFNLTLFWRVVRDLHVLLHIFGTYYIIQGNYYMFCFPSGISSDLKDYNK